MNWLPFLRIDNLHTDGTLPSGVSVLLHRCLSFPVQTCGLLYKMAFVPLTCYFSLQVGAFAWHANSSWFAPARICAFLRQSAQFRYELVRFLTNRCGLYNSVFFSAARAQCREECLYLINLHLFFTSCCISSCLYASMPFLMDPPSLHNSMCFVTNCYISR